MGIVPVVRTAGVVVDGLGLGDLEIVTVVMEYGAPAPYPYEFRFYPHQERLLRKLDSWR